MNATTHAKLRFDCVDDARLLAADVRLVGGVVEITCTNPFDTIELSCTHLEGCVDQLIVSVRDADGDVIKEDQFAFDAVDWIVIDDEHGYNPDVDYSGLGIRPVGGVDRTTLFGDLDVGVSIRRRISLGR